MKDESLFWLVNRIKYCTEHRKGSAKKHIFRGKSEWNSHTEAENQNTVMNQRLIDARDLGLIIYESGEKKWRASENWKLTPAGELYLLDNS